MAAPLRHMRLMFTPGNTCFRNLVCQNNRLNSVCYAFYSQLAWCHNEKVCTTSCFSRKNSKQVFHLLNNKNTRSRQLFPIPLCLNVQCSRTFSSDSNPDVKGAVIYVQNPLSWLKTKWIIFNLHNKYDKTFSVEEFLVGAKQALCVVTELLSQKRFAELHGLVHQEVISWLKQRLDDMTNEETEALNLQDENIAVLKARGMKLVENKEEVKLYIDTLCFGLRRDSNLSNGIPFLVNLGFRFCRDYSTTPPGDWYIGGVTHMSVQPLVS